LLGTEFERLSDVKAVNQALVRLASVFGAPWGRDAKLAQLQGREWEAALSDLPAIALDRAVSDWIRGNRSWPRPADLREIVDRDLKPLVEDAVQKYNMHERRIKPLDTWKGFLFTESPLRRNPTWAAWLNSIHPTAEHVFFKNATIGKFAHEVEGMNSFEIGYVLNEFGEAMAKLFGRPIHFRPSDPKPEISPVQINRPKIDEAERLRRVGLCRQWRQEYGFGKDVEPVPESDAPEASANQTSSPPTGSDDFSDTHQREGSDAAE